MIEYIYSTHKSIKAKSDLLSLCFEFGTLGESVKQNVESLKALVFENNIRFRESTPKIIEYKKENGVNVYKTAVAIIGAGPAGMTAGYEISKNENFDCVIYERTAEVGVTVDDPFLQMTDAWQMEEH